MVRLLAVVPVISLCEQEPVSAVQVSRIVVRLRPSVGCRQKPSCGNSRVLRGGGRFFLFSTVGIPVEEIKVVHESQALDGEYGSYIAVVYLQQVVAVLFLAAVVEI